MNNIQLLIIKTYIYDIDYHESNLEVWVNNINILKYIYQSETKPRTATGNLDLLFEYLEETLKFIQNDQPFPYLIEGNSSFELINKAAKTGPDNEDAFFDYFMPVHDWRYEHSWSHTRLNSYLANVMFRKVDDCIEISWDNRDLYDDVQFISLEGCVRIPCDEYRRVILKAIEDYHQLWDKS